MLAYQIKIALKSLRRNPVLSALLLTGIAIGIAISTTFVTTHYIFTRNPIPEKSDQLHYVQLDAWNPDRPWDDNRPEEPPNQITYQDMQALLESDIPTYQTANYIAELTIRPEGDATRPYRETVRMCFADFFTMFDVPFRYGTGWGRDADLGPEPVVVLDAATNDRLFGGADSVGRTLRVEDRDFTIVGVLAPWRPVPKYYDTLNDAYGEPEGIYLPFYFNLPFEAYSAGNTVGWKSFARNDYQSLLRSESVWVQMWVQLDDASQKEEYLAFLDAYAREQRRLGRFQRPINNRVRSVMEWLAVDEVVPEESRTMLIIGLLFLVVCSVNLIGILLGKFLARAPEVGVRRALGASKRSIFVQHLIECEVVGVLGGILGLLLSVGALGLINSLFERGTPPFSLDLKMVGAGLFLSLVAGAVAGLYPAWRICRVAPASHLKLQ